MSDTLTLINITDISPNPYQPRLSFKGEELEELAQSIRANGLIQPIIVRESAILGYELIAGERRLKAAKLAGLTQIPALIKQISPQKSMQLAIIENLQRSDLNPIEEAQAYQQLLHKTPMTHEELAQFMGKSRPYISNSLRLLKLPDTLSQAVKNQTLSAGHARLLLSLKSTEEQEKWLQKIQEENISVRQLETLLNKTPQKRKKETNKDIFTNYQEAELSKQLGLPVKIVRSKNSRKGEVRLIFQSDDDLNRIINKLK